MKKKRYKNYMIKLVTLSLLWSLCGCTLEPAGQGAEKLVESLDTDKQDFMDTTDQSQDRAVSREEDPSDTTANWEAPDTTGEDPTNTTQDEEISYRDIIRDRFEENEIFQKYANVIYDYDIYMEPKVTNEEVEEVADEIVFAHKQKVTDLTYNKIRINCYGDSYQIDMTKKMDKKQLSNDLLEMVTRQREYMERDFETFHKQLSRLKNLYLSDSGEYYFLISKEHFYEDCKTMKESLDTIKKYNPLETDPIRSYAHPYLVYSEDGNEYKGFTGDSYSIYFDEYLPENKISERLFLNGHMAISDIFRACVFDYDQVDHTQIDGNCSNTLWFEKTEFVLYTQWYEYQPSFDLEMLSDYTYTLYESIKQNKDFPEAVSHMRMEISGRSYSGVYNVECDHIDTHIDLKEDYTKEEWKEMIESLVDTYIEDEPV